MAETEFVFHQDRRPPLDPLEEEIIKCYMNDITTYRAIAARIRRTSNNNNLKRVASSTIFYKMPELRQKVAEEFALPRRINTPIGLWNALLILNKVTVKDKDSTSP